MNNYVQHPIGAIVPPPTEEEFNKLIASIRSGYDREQPVWLYEGKILDGWSRHQAAKQAGVDPIYEDYPGNKPYHFVRSRNVFRRHMSNRQIAMVEAKMVNDLARESGIDRATVIEDIAKNNGVNAKTVVYMETVQNEGGEELRQAVFDGKIRPAAAAGIAKLPKKEQKSAVVRATKPRRRRKKAAPAEPPEIANGDGLGDAHDEDITPEPSDTNRDADGQPIPKKLLDVFGHGNWHDNTVEVVKGIAKHAKSVYAANPYMMQKEFEESTKALIAAVRNSKPHVVHRSCRGNGCKGCLNSGFLTKEQLSKLEGGSDGEQG